MKDIELRFVERDERTALDTYSAIVRKIKILQFRKKLLDGWENEYWTDWQDVPTGVEEKEQEK